MSEIKKYLKNVDTYRYLFSVLLILATLILSIGFQNAGTNYEQAICFRPMCIALGLLVLINIDYKKWIKIQSLVAAVLLYVILHFAYLKQIVPDICEYKYPIVIRMGKIVIIIWSIIYLTMITDIIKKKSWKNIKECKLIPLLVLALYMIFALVMGFKYTEQNFLIVEFIALFYLFRDEKKKTFIISALKDAILLSFVFVIYESLCHRPYDTERYQLCFGNSNLAGTYLAGVTITIFVKITDIWNSTVSKKKKLIMLIAFYIVMGFCCSLVLFNYTRTTIAGLILAFFTALVAELIGAKKKGSVFGRYMLVIASTIALFYITFIVIRYVPAYANDPHFFVGERNDDCKIQKDESIDSKKYTTMGSYLRIVFGKWGILIDFEAMENNEEAEETVIDGRDVTNGRTEVWGLFIPEFRLTGHYPRYVYDEAGEIIPHAHNSYFQVIYEDGLITGGLYILLMLVLYVYGIIAVIKNKSSDNILSLLFIGCVMVSQCFEWINRPQYILYVMTIFIIMSIVAGRKEA